MSCFRIDHPDDAENKYQMHSCDESPEAIYFCSSTAVFEERGNFVVESPGYFANFRHDPRHQLTAIAAPMPMPMPHPATAVSEDSLANVADMRPKSAVARRWFRTADDALGSARTNIRSCTRSVRSKEKDQSQRDRTHTARVRGKSHGRRTL